MTREILAAAAEEADLESVLQAHGIVVTRQRIDIARVLLARHQHLSADDLMARLVEHGAAVSKATVYNTLGLFARRGLVREVLVDRSKVFYDSNTSPHHHFYDPVANTLLDIDDAEIKLGDMPSLPAGMTVDTIDIVVRLRRQPPRAGEPRPLPLPRVPVRPARQSD